jgi:hypothetical protein
MKFLVGKMALEQFLYELLWFSLLIIIPPLLHTRVSLPHEVCDKSDQAAHYHILGV